MRYFESAHTTASRGNSAARNSVGTVGAVPPSSRLAAVTTTAGSNPGVSVTMCRFRPRTRLPPSVPTSAPPEAVLAGGLSMRAPLGVGSRPAVTRTATRGAVASRPRVPSASNARTTSSHVVPCGRSCGGARHRQPSAFADRMPFRTSRRSYLRGRRLALAAGSTGRTDVPWASARSPGDGLRVIPTNYGEPCFLEPSLSCTGFFALAGVPSSRGRPPLFTPRDWIGKSRAERNNRRNSSSLYGRRAR